MPRGPILTDVEKGKIPALDSTVATRSSIAHARGLHRITVQRFLARPQRRQEKKFKARKKKLTDAGHRLLIREASKTRETAPVLKNRLNLNISVWRIQEILHETSYLQHKKMQRAPLLKKLHRSARKEFARQKLE